MIAYNFYYCPLFVVLPFTPVSSRFAIGKEKYFSQIPSEKFGKKVISFDRFAVNYALPYCLENLSILDSLLCFICCGNLEQPWYGCLSVAFHVFIRTLLLFCSRQPNNITILVELFGSSSVEKLWLPLGLAPVLAVLLSAYRTFLLHLFLVTERKGCIHFSLLWYLFQKEGGPFNLKYGGNAASFVLLYRISLPRSA